jgi:serine/threonine-protein kinase
MGASWGPDDTIVFATTASGGLFSVAASGGEPKRITEIDPRKMFHAFPSFVDERHVVFTVSDTVTVSSGRTTNRYIAIVDLRGGTQRKVLDGVTSARLTTQGLLLYVIDDLLAAARFDVRTLSIVGNPVQSGVHVSVTQFGAANYDVSQDGALAYVPARVESDRLRTLVWSTRDGSEEPLKAPAHGYLYPRIAPDGNTMIADVRDQTSDLWRWDFLRQTLSRLTLGQGRNSYPVWSPDGTQVAFVSSRNGSDDIYIQSADFSGTPEQLTHSGNVLPYSFAPDGKSLVIRQVDPSTGVDIGILHLDGARQVEPLLNGKAAELNGEISPDGRWLAYQSDESGRPEVYVRPFPHTSTGRWQVSSDGGVSPGWSPRGDELFYLEDEGMMSASISTNAGFNAARPRKLFTGRFFNGLSGRPFDVSKDGRRFLMVKATQTDTQSAMVVVSTNWVDQQTRALASR